MTCVAPKRLCLSSLNNNDDDDDDDDDDNDEFYHLEEKPLFQYLFTLFTKI